MSESRTNSMAIAALVFGILSFFCCGPIGGLLAIICGILALFQSGAEGRMMAIAGMILGAINVVLAVLWIFVMGGLSVLLALLGIAAETM